MEKSSAGTAPHKRPRCDRSDAAPPGAAGPRPHTGRAAPRLALRRADCSSAPLRRRRRTPRHRDHHPSAHLDSQRQRGIVVQHRSGQIGNPQKPAGHVAHYARVPARTPDQNKNNDDGQPQRGWQEPALPPRCEPFRRRNQCGTPSSTARCSRCHSTSRRTLLQTVLRAGSPTAARPWKCRRR